MNKKKLLALLMALVMTLTLVPVTALAEEVVFTEVSTAEELTNALADSAVSAIKLTDNISVSGAMMISRDLIIDGNGNTITSSANRGFRVKTAGVDVTIQNLTITGAGLERAIQVDSGIDNVTLTINSVIATATDYTVNICGGVDNLAMTITNSDLTGWGAINLYGSGLNVTISDSKLTGINNQSKNDWNNFGVVVLEGDTTLETTDHSSDYNVIISNSTITAQSTTGNRQSVILHNVQSNNNRVTLDSCSVVMGENCEFFRDNSTGSVTKVKPKTGENLPELSAYYVYSDFDNEGYSTINGTVAFLCNVDGENLNIVQSFSTLKDAFAAAADGQVVYMIRDVVQDEGIEFNKSGATVVFLMANRTLTVNTGSNVNNRAIKILNGTLEVYNGTIVAAGSGTTSSNGTGCYGAFRVEKDGELIAENLTLKNYRPYGLNVKVLGGKAELTNVTINSSYGGGIEVTEADLGNHSQTGEATLNNCTFTQTGYFDHCSTTVSVSGGSELIVNGGTYTSDNHAIYVFSSGGYIKIKDGSFKGDIIGSIDKNTYGGYDGGIEITDGKFIITNTVINAPAYLAISGGIFKTSPSDSYIVNGYEAVANTDEATKTEYPFMVTAKNTVNTKDDETEVGVTTSQTSNVAANNTIDAEVQHSIEANTTVTGVVLTNTVTAGENQTSGLQAVVDAAKAGDANTSATDATSAIADAASIDVKVDVTVTPTTYSTSNTESKAYFSLVPTATVTTKDANGETTATISDVAVTNDMINQNQDITVNIYTGFEPQTIIHRADDGSIIEVFSGSAITYSNGVATVTIHHFSTLEATAGGYVAEIGNAKFTTLGDAFAAAQDGDTITLLQNVSLNDRLFVNAGATPAYAGANNRYATTSDNKAITLDMNGHNIQSSSNIALAGGSLNITGTGTISTSNSGLAPVEIRGTGNLENKRTLTIGSGVTLDGEEYGLNVFGSNDAQKNLIDVNVNGTVNGTLFVLGNLTNTANEINIVVNGTVNGGNEEVGIALNGYGNVTVNGGANVSGKTGIEVRAGKLTVNGGTITGKGAYAAPTHNGSGTTSSGAAVAVAQHSTKLPINVTLTGGTLSATGANGKAVVVADPEGNETIADSVQVVATESFKNNSAVDEDYEWVAYGNNYTLQEKPVKALGGSLRRRATNGGNGNIVYNETDLRFGFTVTDAGHFSTVDSYFTYSFGDYTSGHITATKIANDGTTNLVLTKVPADYFNTEITVTLHAFNINGEEIGTATLTKSVKEVAYALRDGGENISQTWKNYAGTIISENNLQN